ncbi:AfsR/SARP family transcriptional regulator [Tenggerimyces flavus]|uniref:BTAD domain-containing putative transcriptional regulator n=1 Tax=Tenggerimyces flavus TaxID=1708749 RepID=A0ABV7YKM4_9ACTN|nr:AfsR/SARP family transcriptional regulator [Tenggerimyces flavus]MBM7784727.1 DNA-binding SARP family transcriptional activator [Tenggerimyces flavus]
MSPPAVSIGLLGPLDVRVAGDQVDVPRGRVRVLLAVLALSAGESVTADALAERIWGEHLPENVRGSLHTLVMRLRRILGADRVATSAGGYLLDVAADAVDATRFGRLLDRADAGANEERALLGEALGLWRGEPFEGTASDWLTRFEAPALVDRRLRSAERLADLDLAVGRAADVVADLRALVREQPLRESLWARLLTGLDRAGRPAEALAEYEQVRTALARELGVAPGAVLQRMQADLLDGVPLAATGTPERHPAPVPVPSQLPADVDDFAGRGQALGTLDELLARSDPPLIVVHGTGGVGKTALVVHWARRAIDAFPDGQLYLDLRGYGPGEPMEPADALDLMLRGLGVAAERLPQDADARSALLRTTLSGRRVLVVLDNARDADQVRPMLPGTGAVVIVTSRSQMRGLAAREQAHRIDLDVLPAEDARAFLAERLKHQQVKCADDALAELADLCGYLPLALTVAAERAGRYPTSPLAALIDELRDERSRLDVLETGTDLSTSLRAAMSWSYRALEADAARLFRLLGLHPGTDIGAPAAAALAGADRRVAARLLDRLAETHLVGSPRPGRYAMHDLVRAYAAERVARDDPDDERDEAVRRLYRWYARTSSSASVAIWGPQAGEVGLDAASFSDELQGMSWFDTERLNLVAVTVAADRVGAHADVVSLVRSMSIYLDLSRAPVEIEPLQELALAAARADGDELAEAQILIQLGRIHDRLGRPELAQPHFESALHLLRTHGDVTGQCAALGNLAITHRAGGRYEQAISLLEQAIDLAGKHGLTDRAAASLNTLAAVYLDDHRVDDARVAITESVRLWRKAGLTLREGIAIDTLGSVHHAGGDHVLAIGSYAEAAEIFRGLSSVWWLAYTLRNAGHAQLAAGDRTAAAASWQEALRIVDELGAEGNAELSRSELLEALESVR